jgi:hypothetical protein
MRGGDCSLKEEEETELEEGEETELEGGGGD